MRIEYVIPVFFAMAVAVPAMAQTTSTGESQDKRGLRIAPAIQKKLTERMAQRRADASNTASSGPFFDHTSKTWTIGSADCPLVKSTIQGTGFKGHSYWIAINDDGSFHLQLRTEGSGTAVDAAGNQYLWIYTGLAELDTPDATVDVPTVTGYGPITFQLIPVGNSGSGYTAAGYIQVDTPTPISSNIVPVSANTPGGCLPF